LVLYNISDDRCDGTDLVIPHGAIDGRPVEELILVLCVLNLVLVKEWELGLKVSFVLVIKKLTHRSAIER
jgi:hypothetical protein